MLVDQIVDNPHLSFVHWLSQFTLPWSLLFLGEWGEALRIPAAEITLADKNGDRFTSTVPGSTCTRWTSPGVLEISDSILPSLGEPERRPWRRFCFALTASAETALGRHAAAADHVIAARDEMDRQPVIHDWYCRMILGQALTDVWLAKGDLTRAGPEAEQFLGLTLATAERTWQALAWEASARVAMAGGDNHHRARTCIERALSTMERYEVPLAAWRVHASTAELERRLGNQCAAGRHRSLGRGTVLALAESLVDHERLRATFLAAPPVRATIDPGRGTRDVLMLTSAGLLAYSAAT